MKFILWTLVWFSLNNASRWIGMKEMGIENYCRWHEKKYSSGVIVLSFMIEIVLYIYLYEHFIRFS